MPVARIVIVLKFQNLKFEAKLKKKIEVDARKRNSLTKI
jgi:hypothetical protein